MWSQYGEKDMRVVDILPVQLGVAMYPEHEKVKSLLIDEIESHGDDYEHKKIDAVTKSLEHLDYYSPLSNDKYKEFREWIELQAEIYAKNILGYDTSDFLLTDSWINVCDAGGKQLPHFHINAAVCALYYVNFDDSSHSPTYFYRPNDSQKYPDYYSYMLTNHKHTKYNNINEVVGLEGSLLLWPANCVHGYGTNYTDNRITISSNLMPRYINSFEVIPLTKDERHTAMTTFRSGQLWDNPDL